MGPHGPVAVHAEVAGPVYLNCNALVCSTSTVMLQQLSRVLRRSLLQINSGEAAAPPAGPALYIYTAVTLDTSRVGDLIVNLVENATAVLDPEGRVGAEEISVQNIIWGKTFELAVAQLHPGVVVWVTNHSSVRPCEAILAPRPEMQ